MGDQCFVGSYLTIVHSLLTYSSVIDLTALVYFTPQVVYLPQVVSWQKCEGMFAVKTAEVTSDLDATMFFGRIDLYSDH